MKQKKSTIRFLKTQKKNEKTPGKSGGPNAKRVFTGKQNQQQDSAPKKNKPKESKHYSDDDEMEDVEMESENEAVIKMPTKSGGSIKK